MVDTGLLIIRAVIGILFIGHGAQKLFGWFGGYGLKGTGGWLESIGMKPGVLMAFAAGVSELAGGLLFGLGLVTWLGAALLIVTMLMAMVKVHFPNGLWVTQNGYEYNLVLIAVALGIAFIGAGEYSIDHLLK
ncbi:putative oxidoreductase [Paenibacillus cellulosilyticus]|uniref:Putative oxidoreductase n=1 Tax=Paenibacillus cellulosilyticus TaxID=375489 RepID=A0A2V2YNT9_9BACL|nr:DoxX family protein [Paenibacillus cellulosilyticus]PWV97818.1 putative oxidoreductase [Paenibacillus cellulosilyticus]QKS47003.1 DoxX family protein [Paenibacillus cellulosilyticus]